MTGVGNIAHNWGMAGRKRRNNGMPESPSNRDRFVEAPRLFGLVPWVGEPLSDTEFMQKWNDRRLNSTAVAIRDSYRKMMFSGAHPVTSEQAYLYADLELERRLADGEMRNWELLERRRVEALEKKAAKADPEEALYAAMTKAAMGKTAPRDEVLEWVRQHLGVALEAIEESSIPDQGAPALLRWARGDPGAFLGPWSRSGAKAQGGNGESQEEEIPDYGSMAAEELLAHFRDRHSHLRMSENGEVPVPSPGPP